MIGHACVASLKVTKASTASAATVAVTDTSADSFAKKLCQCEYQFALGCAPIAQW